MSNRVLAFVYGEDRGPIEDAPYELINACTVQGLDRDQEILIGFGLLFGSDWMLDWKEYAIYLISDEFDGEDGPSEDLSYVHLHGECIAGEPWIRPGKDTSTLSIPLED